MSSVRVHELMELFLLKSELVDLWMINLGKDPACVRTARYIFEPEIIFCSDLPGESKDLVTALTMLSGALDLVLTCDVTQN